MTWNMNASLSIAWSYRPSPKGRCSNLGPEHASISRLAWLGKTRPGPMSRRHNLSHCAAMLKLRMLNTNSQVCGVLVNVRPITIKRTQSVFPSGGSRQGREILHMLLPPPIGALTRGHCLRIAHKVAWQEGWISELIPPTLLGYKLTRILGRRARRLRCLLGGGDYWTRKFRDISGTDIHAFLGDPSSIGSERH